MPTKRDATFGDLLALRDLVARRIRVVAAIKSSNDPDVLDVLEEELRSLSQKIASLESAIELPPAIKAARQRVIGGANAA